MKKIILVSVFILAPVMVCGFTAGDFTVNNQPTYSIPPGTTQVLILDLTLPEQIDSIKFENEGTVQSYNISQLTIFKDGSSPGWDNSDETAIFIRSSSPFWDETFDLPSFSGKRIFITLNIAAGTISGRTVKLKAVVGDISVVGPARTISADAPIPDVPVTPLARTPEALSTSTIRWHFTDLSNNEFGFKILDGNSKVVVKKEQADISYLDETGLKPNTEYSARRVVAFNDRGESLTSPLAVFPAVWTLKEAVTGEIVEEPAESESIQVGEEEVAEEEPISQMSVAEINAKITELQEKLIELLNQLVQLLLQQIAAL